VHPAGWLAGGAGVLLVWGGFTNPERGLLGELGAVLRGEQPTPLRRTGSDWSSGRGGGGGWGDGGSTPPAELPPPSTGQSAGAAAVLAFARAQIGDPYLWGGNGPDRWDCSGLTVAAFRQVGVALPRTAALQQFRGQTVDGLQRAVPGDLLFYGAPAWHVAIYAGGGRMVEAPRTGLTVREAAARNPTSIRRVLPSADTRGLVP